MGRTIRFSLSESETAAGWEGLVATARVVNFLLKRIGVGDRREPKAKGVRVCDLRK